MKEITIHVRAPSKTSRLLTFNRIPELSDGEALHFGFAIDGNALALQIADGQTPSWAFCRRFEVPPEDEAPDEKMKREACLRLYEAVWPEADVRSAIKRRAAILRDAAATPSEQLPPDSLIELLRWTEGWLKTLLVSMGYQVTFD